MNTKKRCILVAVILLAVYVSQQKSSVEESTALQVAHEELPVVAAASEIDEDIAPEPLAADRVLHIPKLKVYSPVAEGEYEDVKDYVNVWRRSHTSAPSRGSNTVIVGHRYRGNAHGYHLYDIDKIASGDTVELYWDDIVYKYKVYNTTEVHETAVEIEDPTQENRLTLYACDWSGKNRLVVQASLDSKEERAQRSDM